MTIMLVHLGFMKRAIENPIVNKGLAFHMISKAILQESMVELFIRYEFYFLQVSKNSQFF